MAEVGSADGLIVAVRTPEREKHFFYSDEPIAVADSFFHLENSGFDWKSINDLKNMTIGGNTGILLR